MTYSGFWEHERFPAYVRLGFFHLFSQDLESFLTHTDQHPDEDVRGIVWRSSKCSLFSLPCKFYMTWPPQILNFVSSTWRMLDSEFVLFVLWQEILHEVNWGNYRTHLICFPSLKDNSLVLPVFQHLKSIVSSILFKFLDVLCWRVNYGCEQKSMRRLRDYVNILLSNIFLFNDFSIHRLFLLLLLPWWLKIVISWLSFLVHLLVGLSPWKINFLFPSFTYVVRYLVSVVDSL